MALHHITSVLKPGRLSLLLLPVVLYACVLQPPAEIGISADEQAYRNFIECKQSALDMDSSARQQQSIAQYSQAAELLSQCVESAAINPQAIPGDEVIPLQALVVVDYLKAGDIESAREQLAIFKEAFQGRDLYFSDNTSFIETAEMLIESPDKTRSQQRYRSVLNARGAAVDELKRREYWVAH